MKARLKEIEVRMVSMLDGVETLIDNAPKDVMLSSFNLIELSNNMLAIKCAFEEIMGIEQKRSINHKVEHLFSITNPKSVRKLSDEMFEAWSDDTSLDQTHISSSHKVMRLISEIVEDLDKERKN